MKNKYKVGQKVKLVDIKPRGHISGGFIDDMYNWLGKEVTIKILRDDYFEVNECKWVWDYKLIDKKSNPRSNKELDVMFFAKEHSILPVGYRLHRVIKNGDAVICIVEDYRRNKEIKAVAVCQEGDTFDLHKGVEICMYKTLRKIADKNLKKF